jgi:hypothetical protein
VRARAQVSANVCAAHSVDTDLADVEALAQVRTDVRVSRDEVYTRIMDEMYRQLYLRVCDELTAERRATAGGLLAQADAFMHHCAQVCDTHYTHFGLCCRRVIPINRQSPSMRRELRTRPRSARCRRRSSRRVFSI